MNPSKIINNTSNSSFMKKIALEKGWNKAERFAKVSEYITSGSKLSIVDWMKSA